MSTSGARAMRQSTRQPTPIGDALCAFNMHGFADWRMTQGSFDAELFNRAAEQILLEPGPNGEPPLIQQFPHVVIDGASYHTRAFDDAVRAAGGRVWRIPAYCAPKLSPLDNGAFGLLTRYLSIHAGRLAHMHIDDAMDEALRYCASPEAARWCFQIPQL